MVYLHIRLNLSSAIGQLRIVWQVHLAVFEYGCARKYREMSNYGAFYANLCMLLQNRLLQTLEALLSFIHHQKISAISGVERVRIGCTLVK